MTECSFCKALSIHKFAEERSEEGFSYRHRAALLTVTKHNNSGNEARSVDYIKNGENRLTKPKMSEKTKIPIRCREAP